MFTVEDILSYFLTENIVETLGNWYPRVCAVMSCVIPFMYISFTMISVAFIAYSLWRWLVRC